MNSHKFLECGDGTTACRPLAKNELFAFSQGRPEDSLTANLARPTAAQLEWQDFEVGVLFELDLPVFAPGGWTDKLQMIKLSQ
jgi:hypothetical protein